MLMLLMRVVCSPVGSCVCTWDYCLFPCYYRVDWKGSFEGSTSPIFYDEFFVDVMNGFDLR